MLFNPQFELTVYAPRSVDPDEATPLTPAAAASHGDPFVVTTVQDIEGTKPYLDIPSARTGTIDPLDKRTSVGTLAVRVFDPRVTAGGGNAARWVTAYMGDGAGGNYLNGRKARVRWRPTPADAWEDYWTGRISATKGDGKLWVDLTLRDLSKDMEAEVFVGAPHSSVADYASLPPIAPVGLLAPYGPASMFPLTTPLVGSVQASPGAEHPFFAIALDLTNGDVARTLITQALVEAERASTFLSSNKRRPGMPLLYVRAAGSSDPWSEYQFGNIGRVETSSIKQIYGQPVEGGPAIPIDGTTVECYVVMDAEASESRPLFINDWNPIDYIAALAAGKLGRLDDAGNPKRAVPINAASFAAASAFAYLPWRKRAVKKSRIVDEIEEVCRAYHLVYYLNESGELCIVNIRRRDTTAPAYSLTDADLEAPSGNLAWNQSGDEAVTAVLVSAVIERYLQNDELPAANAPISEVVTTQERRWRMGPDFPDVSAGRVIETTADVLVPFIGPRAADVRPSTRKLEVTGLRVGVSADGKTYETAASGKSRLEAIRAHIAELAGELTGPFGLGPRTIDIVCRRGSASADAVRQGMFVGLTLTALPDPATNLRGGPRLGLCLSRIDDGKTVRLRFLDAGADSVALVPTLGALDSIDENQRVSVTVPVTLNASDEAARLRYALTATDVAVEPGTDSGLWTSVEALVTAGGTAVIGGIPYGKRVWVQGRSEPTAGLGFKLPSAWASPAGSHSIDIAALPAPSDVAVTGATAGESVASWTLGADWPDVEVLLVAGGSPASWSDDDLIARLDPGSIELPIGARLQPGTQYTVGVRHRDPQLGSSSVAEVTFVAGGATVLPAPDSPDGFSRRGSVLPFGSMTGGFGGRRYGRVYGLAVRAITFPADVEFAEAIETAPGSGVYGAYATVGKTVALGETWTTWERQVSYDGRKRKLKARQVRDGAEPSEWTAEVIVDPSVDDPIAAFPSGNLFQRGVHTIADVAGGVPWEYVHDTPDTIEGYGLSVDFVARGDARWSQLGHTHAFAELTGKPTTIGGYGITDFNSLGDARWGQLGAANVWAEAQTAPDFILGEGGGGEPPGTPGLPVAVLDEGVSLTPEVASINVTGPGAQATAVGNAVTINVPHTWSSLVGKPTTFAGFGITAGELDSLNVGGSQVVTNNGGTWNIAVVGSAGSVAWGNVTGKPSTIGGYGITNFINQAGTRFGTDFNTLLETGFYNANETPPNSPAGSGYGNLIVAHGIDTGLQLYGGYLNDELWFRGWHSSGAGFSSWRRVLHDGNYAAIGDPRWVQLANLNALGDARWLQLTGGTLSGHITFGADNTYDIGRAYPDTAAGKPRRVLASTSFEVGFSIGQPALSGVWRMPNNTSMVARRAANDGDVHVIGVGIGNQVSVAGDGGPTTVGGDLYVGESTGASWVRTYGPYGLYNQSFGTHLYWSSTERLNVASQLGALSAHIRLVDGYEGTSKGFVYWSASGFGMLTNAGAWTFRAKHDLNTAFVGGSAPVALGNSSNGYPMVGYNFYGTNVSGGWAYEGSDYAQGIFFQADTMRFLLAPSGVAGLSATFGEYFRISTTRIDSYVAHYAPDFVLS